MHTTPFEMCEIKLHVKLPIFVARQWVRHRTASINEYSARYSVLEREFYVPDLADIAEQSLQNKQGRSKAAKPQFAQSVRRRMIKDGERAFDTYDAILGPGPQAPEGLSRELARIGLPLSTYTEWYWKIDLHNLFHFLKLRADEHAQLEIRKYANAILSIVESWVPSAYAAFVEYQLKGTRFSHSAINAVIRLMRGEKLSREDTQLSRREWDELQQLLSLDGRSLK